MYYYIAYAYFGKGDYRTSLRWVSKIISNKTDLRSDILCFSRLLNLILHIELDNQLQLEYVFKFLKKSITPLNPKTQRESFLSFKTELLQQLNDPHEHRALEYFDFISWLDSKIEGKPFMLVIQEKYEGEQH